jgi:transcriptional regulator with XRE-family HTH domain
VAEIVNQIEASGAVVARTVGPEWRGGLPSAEERLLAQELGAMIRARRIAINMSQVDLANQAGIGTRHLRRLEYGERRTRGSTLVRIASALATDQGAAEACLSELLRAAGPSIAPESDFIARVERRRPRRLRHRPSKRCQIVTIPLWSPEGWVRRTAREWPDGSRRVRHSVRYAFVSPTGVEARVPASPEIMALFSAWPIPGEEAVVRSPAA